MQQEMFFLMSHEVKKLNCAKSTVGRCATSICKHFKWNDFWFLTCEKWIYCGYALLVICTVVLVLLFFFSSYLKFLIVYNL